MMADHAAVEGDGADMEARGDGGKDSYTVTGMIEQGGKAETGEGGTGGGGYWKEKVQRLGLFKDFFCWDHLGIMWMQAYIRRLAQPPAPFLTKAAYHTSSIFCSPSISYQSFSLGPVHWVRRRHRNRIWLAKVRSLFRVDGRIVTTYDRYAACRGASLLVGSARRQRLTRGIESTYTIFVAGPSDTIGHFGFLEERLRHV